LTHRSDARAGTTHDVADVARTRLVTVQARCRWSNHRRGLVGQERRQIERVQWRLANRRRENLEGEALADLPFDFPNSPMRR
jgi:hypothetical protein